MNKPSISNNLELAEKALEVMGWKQTGFLAGPTHKNGDRTFLVKRTSPLSNDLAAEGKRWLLSKKTDMVIMFHPNSVSIYLGPSSRAILSCPTENEAVLRAVVEIGTRDN